MPLRQVDIAPTLTTDLMTAFERTVSPERWRTYQLAAGFSDELALRLYLWNAAMGQSFHFPLQTVEVALRNVSHHALSARFGDDWPNAADCRAILTDSQQRDTQKALRLHQSKHGQNPTSAQLVASLPMGFWTALVNRRNEAILWNHHRQLAFPHLSTDQSIHDVEEAATTVRTLRNRIFHQEPLIGRNLSADYAAILRLLAWICPETREWMRAHSSVPRVIRERPR